MTCVLGRTAEGQTVALSPEERSRHVHIVGASGTGKSKLVESLIRQDITAGRGLCLIDPHGTLADAIVAWCAATGMNEFRRIHVIEPSDLGWAVGFNPLRMDGATQMQVRVDAMVAACAQVWGGENPSATPLLKKCLRAVFHTLAVHELTLVEAPLLTHGTDSRLRRSLTEPLVDSVYAGLWRDFDRLPQREFFEQFSSTNNRLLEFLSSPVVRRVIGQQASTLDVREVMDRGDVVLVNLAYRGALSPDNARLLGTLLTSDFFLTALARDPDMARRRPFTLYIDECGQFVTSDIEGMLDQTRKFGLHLVLAHQRLGQLGDRTSSIYNGVMTGGQTKVVFGGLEDDDAQVLAREVMRSSINLERPKRSLNKPVVVDEEPYWLESESWSESEGHATGSSASSAWGSSDGLSSGVAEAYDLNDQLLGTSLSAGGSSAHMEGGGTSVSESRSVGTGRAWGRSQTLKPVRAWLPTAVYSLDEELHLAVVKLRELPKQAAIVKRRGALPVRVRPPTVKDALATRERQARFVAAARHQSPYLRPAAEVDAEIAARDWLIHQGPAPAANGTDAFWSEDEA